MNCAALIIYVDAACCIWHKRANINSTGVEDILVINIKLLKWVKKKAYNDVRAACTIGHCSLDRVSA